MNGESFERKLAAIFYADVAGYSRLTGQNEDDTHRALRTHLDTFTGAIEAHGGKVVHFAGDAVLADFVTASNALACAAELQRDLAARNVEVPVERRVQFRIGINLGEVIVDRDDIYGDGVNVAARLESLAEPGGICVSESVYAAVGNKLALGYQFMGEQPVKNIDKPVRAYRVLLDPTSAAAARPKAPAVRRVGRSSWLLGAAVFTLLLLAGLGWLMRAQPPATPQDRAAPGRVDGRPSIAVLPFDNLSGDPSEDYFSDGITDDLINDLAQVSGLFVIARNSVFTYKGLPVKVQQVGSELGVSHILEGSVLRVGNRVRINTQLIDVGSEHPLWAERYDRELDDVLALQDEVTQSIVSALEVTLTPKEEKRLRESQRVNPVAYDYFLRGLERFRRFSQETNAEARELFTQAAAQDPQFARAFADVALTYSIDALLGWADPNEIAEIALTWAKQALELDEANPHVHFALSNLYMTQRRSDDAIAAARRAVALDPNYADGYGQLAVALNHAGRPQEALTAMATAMRLNPRYAFYYTWINGQSKFLLGRFAEAAEDFRTVVQRNALFPDGHLMLAATLAQLGETEDAEWAASELLVLHPDFSIARARAKTLYKRPQDQDLYFGGLELAGLPQ
ncbi:MAG: tetratricopeptide repeat protein [Gammaproteobacteria bacterium]|nr:tetratricopeptide repeat protein [Gammaproteobacteria bacterium]